MKNDTIRSLGIYTQGPLIKNRTNVVSQARMEEGEGVAGRLRTINNVRLSFNAGLSTIRWNLYKNRDNVGALNLRGTRQYLNFRTTR